MKSAINAYPILCYCYFVIFCSELLLFEEIPLYYQEGAIFHVLKGEGSHPKLNWYTPLMLICEWPFFILKFHCC